VIDPVNVLAWSGKGYALMKLGRLSEAIEPLETAVRLDPNIANAWINLGEAQLRSRNLGRAIQSLEKA
jgi:cytochrome c-type biogenesis protein CcmH/NrfG